MRDRLLLLVIIVVGILFFTSTHVIAHSGRTDSSGGHNCRVGSCAGTYHYHNGGSSSYIPPTPNYYQDGLSDGKAHASREAINIELRGEQTGYKDGYNLGMSATPKPLALTHPDSICNTAFTFDAGTNETYKRAYNAGWLSACDTYASQVYQAGYDRGYAAGKLIRSAPTTTTLAATTATIDTRPDSEDEQSTNNDWVFWAVAGVIFGAPFILGAGSIFKEWYHQL